VRLHEELENEDVQCGPGAGLLTNSLIASLLGLTRFDPLRFDLSFELPPGMARGPFPLLEVAIPDRQEPGAVAALRRLFENQVAAVGEWKTWKTTAALERIATLLGRDGRWAHQALRDADFQRARESASSRPAGWIPDAKLPLDDWNVVAWLAGKLEG